MDKISSLEGRRESKEKNIEKIQLEEKLKPNSNVQIMGAWEKGRREMNETIQEKILGQ